MNRHSNLCDADNSILLIVDIQARLTAAMPKTDAAGMLASSIRLIKSAALLNIPVLVTEQYPKGLGKTDAGIIAALTKTALVFEKTGFSCCAASGLEQALEQTQRRQIILAGQECHVCVLQSALDLQQRDFQVQVPEDSVCSRNNDHKDRALLRMQHQGITVTTHESVLFEWLQDASHPHFKVISSLLR